MGEFYFDFFSILSKCLDIATKLSQDFSPLTAKIGLKNSVTIPQKKGALKRTPSQIN